VQVTRHLSQPERALLLAEHLLDRRHVLPPIPELPALRMHPVHEDVQVRVLAIAVRDDQRLVLFKAEPGEHPVGDPFHRRAVHRIAGVERQG
jgi:hypothetical protein